MSRFAEGDGWEDEQTEREFYRDLSKAYVLAREDLRGFLAHLDAMPKKRIIASRFVDPKTMDACAVGEFCRYKGTPKLALLKAEGESFAQRHESGEYWTNPQTGVVEFDMGTEESGGFEGPTVAMGEKAGLPTMLAYNLAWKNDMNWTTVERCVIEWPGVQGIYPSGKKRGSEGLVPVACGERGTHWLRPPYREILYRDMTPEERWQKLRDHIALALENPKWVAASE